MTQDQPDQPPQIDTGVASIARIYDYWLGGKDNFKAYREAAELMIQQYPDIVTGVRKNRAFLGRAVHYLAADAGIRQFLDIGTGLPSSNNTHEVAQRAAPDARIVYVDNDPIVLSHAEALLTSTPEGACAYVDADIRDTGKILKDAATMAPTIVAIIGGKEYADANIPIWPFAFVGSMLSLVQILLFSRIASADRKSTVLLWLAVAVEIVLVTVWLHGELIQVVTAAAISTSLLVLAGAAIEIRSRRVEPVHTGRDDGGRGEQ